MPNINAIYPSKYLKGSDVGPEGKVLTIKSVSVENVARPNDPPDVKPVLAFKGTDKKLAVGKQVAQVIARISGSEDTDNWANTRLRVYFDENVSYGGRVTGGIRVSTPPATQAKDLSQPAAAQQLTTSESTELKSQADLDDDIPF